MNHEKLKFDLSSLNRRTWLQIEQQLCRRFLVVAKNPHRELERFEQFMPCIKLFGLIEPVLRTTAEAVS